MYTLGNQTCVLLVNALIWKLKEKNLHLNRKINDDNTELILNNFFEMENNSDCLTYAIFRIPQVMLWERKREREKNRQCNIS